MRLAEVESGPEHGALASLLGASLLRADGAAEPTAAALGHASFVLLLFTADHSVSGRRIAPAVAAFAQRHAEKSIAVVVAPTDAEPAAALSSLAALDPPGAHAVPLEATPRLEARFGIRGVPALVVIDAGGDALCTDALPRLLEDPAGEGFPWARRTVWEAVASAGLAKKMADGSEAEATVEELRAADTIAVLFSADWSPPCRALLPYLAPLLSLPSPPALLLVPSDADPPGRAQQLALLPAGTFSLPCDPDAEAELADLLGVTGIPALVVLRSDDGAAISRDGAERIKRDPAGFPWPPRAVVRMADAFAADSRGVVAAFEELLSPSELDAFESVAASRLGGAWVFARASEPAHDWDAQEGEPDDEADAVRSLHSFLTRAYGYAVAHGSAVVAIGPGRREVWAWPVEGTAGAVLGVAGEAQRPGTGEVTAESLEGWLAGIEDGEVEPEAPRALDTGTSSEEEEEEVEGSGDEDSMWESEGDEDDEYPLSAADLQQQISALILAQAARDFEEAGGEGGEAPGGPVGGMQGLMEMLGSRPGAVIDLRELLAGMEHAGIAGDDDEDDPEGEGVHWEIEVGSDGGGEGTWEVRREDGMWEEVPQADRPAAGNAGATKPDMGDE